MYIFSRFNSSSLSPKKLELNLNFHFVYNFVVQHKKMTLITFKSKDLKLIHSQIINPKFPHRHLIPKQQYRQNKTNS